MKPTIYLAGPISGLTWDQALTWREQTVIHLAKHFHILDPLKPQRGKMTNRMDIITGPSREATDLPIHFTGSGLVTSDEFYVRKSDFLFVNFLYSSDQISAGTLWEMGLAWGLNKFIVTVIQPENIHDNVFVRRRSHIFVPTYGEAIEYFINL